MIPRKTQRSTSAGPVRVARAGVRNRRALLIFSDGPALDLARRRWPRQTGTRLLRSRWDALTVDADCHLFTSPWGAPPVVPGIRLHRQTGRTFGERLSRAVATLTGLGYEQIVIVGSDCPSLCRADVERAFAGLRRHRAVLGPDHKGGVYLIGLHARDREVLGRVGWRRNTDCRQLADFFGRRLLWLPTRQDLDDLEDLQRLAASGEFLSRQAAAFLACFPAPPPAPLPLPLRDHGPSRWHSDRAPPGAALPVQS